MILVKNFNLKKLYTPGSWVANSRVTNTQGYRTFDTKFVIPVYLVYKHVFESGFAKCVSNAFPLLRWFIKMCANVVNEHFNENFSEK